MPGKIFISYRRDDTAPWAGRLYERLLRDFKKSQLFIDVDDIRPGIDFVRALDEQVAACDVFLCMIGKDWLEARNEQGERRIDDPQDFVRIEVESALNRNVHVVPVLVDGARMPRRDELPESVRDLTRRNAIEITHSKFGADATALTNAIKAALRSPRAKPRPEVPSSITLEAAEASPLLEKDHPLVDISLALVCLAAFAMLPSLGSDYFPAINIGRSAALYCIGPLSLRFLLRCGGPVSLGHIAFWGVGAFVTAQTVSTLGLTGALATAVLVSAAFAATTGAGLIAIPGIIALLATLALGEMMHLFLEWWAGPTGVSLGSPISNNVLDYFLLGCVAATYAILRVRESLRVRIHDPIRVLFNVRSLNDERATYWGRLADFVLSGASCGFGGAVLAVFYGFIQGDLYSWVTSVTFLGIALIGGRYLLSTAIAGTALYFIIQQALSSYVPIPQLHTLVGPGLILLALLVYVGPTKLLGSKKVRS